MDQFIAGLSAVTILIAIPLTVLKPSWLFYLFLICTVFANILGGHVYAAGNLGLPRAWQPGDVLGWLTLAAAVTLPRNDRLPPEVMKKCMAVIAILSAASLALGLVLYFDRALTHSRALHFVPAMLFAGRYLTNTTRINTFLRFTTSLLLLMFVVHVSVRFGVYTPPISREVTGGQLVGERGEDALALVLYLALISMALGRFGNQHGSRALSAVMLLTGLCGAALSETRTLYGAVAGLGLVAVLFVRGRIRSVIILALALCLVLWAAAETGFDLTARFRAHFGRGRLVMPFSQGPTWRTLEYQLILRSYIREPFLIFTGRGIGATHTIPGTGFIGADISYYHSEYLGWLDKLGLLGLAAFLTMCGACLRRSFRLARSRIKPLGYYGSTVFLLMAALMAFGLLNPCFMNLRSGALLICFVGLIANLHGIHDSFQSRRCTF